jgi:hypothetical protein
VLHGPAERKNKMAGRGGGGGRAPVAAGGEGQLVGCGAPPQVRRADPQELPAGRAREMHRKRDSAARAGAATGNRIDFIGLDFF